jgi:UDP:flavonoid glycosyltransferase YjiC (YdhE family)
VPPDLRAEALPANARIAPWVDHAQLLPKCAAVVTPGGAGTIVAALAAGVPLVVVPTAWDKPDNAQRVAEAGVGARLSPRHCTPEHVRAAVDRVLLDPAYRERAQRMAALLAAAPGPAGAAALLERLAGGRSPAGRTEMEV